MRIQRTTDKMAAFAVALVVISGLAVGCTSSRGDTSGFKPEQKPTKDQLAKQIDDIKANPKIPAPIKESALKKLQEQMASAK